MRLQINKLYLRRIFLLGGIGFILCWAIIYTSADFEHARAFLQSDHKIKDEFGEVKFDVLYSARLKNSQSNFSFYLFAEKKNGVVRVEVDKSSGVWSVHGVRE
jgi:hypothetical protein